MPYIFPGMIFNALNLSSGVFDITVSFNETASVSSLPAMINAIGNAICKFKHTQALIDPYAHKNTHTHMLAHMHAHARHARTCTLARTRSHARTRTHACTISAELFILTSYCIDTLLGGEGSILEYQYNLPGAGSKQDVFLL